MRNMNKKLNFINSNLFYETRKYMKIREIKINSDSIDLLGRSNSMFNNMIAFF